MHVLHHIAACMHAGFKLGVLAIALVCSHPICRCETTGIRAAVPCNLLSAIPLPPMSAVLCCGEVGGSTHPGSSILACRVG